MTFKAIFLSVFLVVGMSSIARAESSFDDFRKTMKETLTTAITPDLVAADDCFVNFIDGDLGTLHVLIQKVSNFEVLATFKPTADTEGSHSASFFGVNTKFTYKVNDNDVKQKIDYHKGTITITLGDAAVACKIAK